MIHVSELRVRDPYILPVPEENGYYLFMNSAVVGRSDPYEAVCALRTADFVSFEEPVPVLKLDKPCATVQCWAPEVHRYAGKWYMLTTHSWRIDGCGIQTVTLPPDEVRGTYIYVADSPLGPYRPWSDGPVTPWSSLALDGTLFVDREGQPWMVYCHEWLQTHDGLMEAIPLTKDLKQAAGDPILLFAGSAAPWSRGRYVDVHEDDRTFPIHDHTHVTDGPFLFYAPDDALCMLWSTWDGEVYKTGIAYSESGCVRGPWKHCPDALFEDDGGHGMLFLTLEGQLTLAIHQPNSAMKERLKLLPVELCTHGLRVKKG